MEELDLAGGSTPSITLGNGQLDAFATIGGWGASRRSSSMRRDPAITVWPASRSTRTIILNGSSGADVLTGSSGNDTIKGNSGNDTIDGGAGDDRLTGGAGADSISGGDGNDVVNVFPSSDATGDSVDGGAGYDRLVVENFRNIAGIASIIGMEELGF